MYIDTHAHLNFKDFGNEIAEILANAKHQKVDAIICASADLESSRRAVDLANKYDNIFATVGLHPEESEKEKFDEQKFWKLAQNKKVVAIGETGLDYHYDPNNKQSQIELFEKHIRLANKVNKPLIIHSRDADQDILAVLTGQSRLPQGVFHCFSGDWEMAKIVLDMGFYLSFTGIITFSKNYANLEVVKNVPLDRILIETDAPFLAPEPYRGKRNEPAYVVEVAKKIAEIRKISLEEVENQTTKNAIELFNLKIEGE